MRIWTCNIYVDEDELPRGFNNVPREAAIEAIQREGINVGACSSEWRYSPSLEMKNENKQIKQRNTELMARISNLETGLRDIKDFCHKIDPVEIFNIAERALAEKEK